jgi:hypothetical protein
MDYERMRLWWDKVSCAQIKEKRIGPLDVIMAIIVFAWFGFIGYYIYLRW